MRKNGEFWRKGYYVDTVGKNTKAIKEYAQNGEVYFKYGKKPRMLQSTSIITDSIQDLYNTALGEKLKELQLVYNSI